MSAQDRKLQKHLVDEMMKVSESNPDVMFYMEALMKKYEDLQQKVEQLENIRKEAIRYIQNNQLYNFDYDKEELFEIVSDKVAKEYLLNILNKGE